MKNVLELFSVMALTWAITFVVLKTPEMEIQVDSCYMNIETGFHWKVTKLDVYGVRLEELYVEGPLMVYQTKKYFLDHFQRADCLNSPTPTAGPTPSPTPELIDIPAEGEMCKL